MPQGIRLPMRVTTPFSNLSIFISTSCSIRYALGVGFYTWDGVADPSFNERLKILEDRFNDFESVFVAYKKPSTKPARNWTVVFLLASAMLVAAPKNISAGGVTYETEGIPLQTITAIAGMFMGGKWCLDGYRENQADKEA